MMAKSAEGQLIRLIRKSELAQDVQAFIIDRQARGLSPRTIEFYADELQYWMSWVGSQGIQPGVLSEGLYDAQRSCPRPKCSWSPIWKSIDRDLTAVEAGFGRSPTAKHCKGRGICSVAAGLC